MTSARSLRLTLFLYLFLAACSAPLSPTPTATSTPPSPTPLPDSYVGLNPQELVAAPGVLPAAGGQEGSQTPVTMTDPLRETLLSQGWAPVYDHQTGNYALIGGDNTTCFSSTRDQVFGSRPDLQVHQLRGVEDGVAIFTNQEGKVTEQTVMDVSLVGAPEGATCIQAIDIRDPQNPALQLLLLAPDGTVMGIIPTFSGEDTVKVIWSHAEGPQLYVNETKTWFVSPESGEMLATLPPPPTETPAPSATPDRVASFEIPADHAPWWAFRGEMAVRTATIDGVDYALYRAIFQPYFLDYKMGKLGDRDVVIATAVYEVDGRKQSVDVIFEPTLAVIEDWDTNSPNIGSLEKEVPIGNLISYIDKMMSTGKQASIAVVVGIGGIPAEVEERNCSPIECQAVDEYVAEVNPQELLDFYYSGSKQGERPVRLLVNNIRLGQNGLLEEGQVSDWPRRQIGQYPLKP